MVFSSLEFIFIFLPFVIVLCFVLPTQYKNIIIFISSLCFYFYGVSNNVIYLLLFIFAIIVNYFLGIAIYKHKRREEKINKYYELRSKKINNKKSYSLFLLRFGIIYNLGILFIFKYIGFVTHSLFSLFHIDYMNSVGNLKIMNLVLPIGISFYTFQACSYIIDVYRGDVKSSKSIINFGAYISLFPQLIAGPIVKYSDVDIDLKRRKKISLYDISEGAKIFIIGLGLKVLVANPLGGLWNAIIKIGYESLSTKLAWISMIGRTFQIYFDFFGYSLMAIGLGVMLGFKFPENFNHPFMSSSISEFWRRWHITLGTWFKEYIYIPLGGNRQGLIYTIRNLFIVWLFTGLWHGAGMSFLIWGLSLFAFVVAEKIFFKKILDRHIIIGRIYVFLVINLTFVIFSITNLNEIAVFFTRLVPFVGKNNVLFEADYLKYLSQYGKYILAAFILSNSYVFKLFKRFRRHPICGIILILIFILSIYHMYMGMDDPFLYFRF